MKLIEQTKKQVQEMEEQGYPLCYKKCDWKGTYQRHCNACIKMFRISIKIKSQDKV